MLKARIKSFSWDFYSILIISGSLALQVIYWQMLPYFMDIHYHLLTAWGFIKAGGVSTWDFWQYAPVGRAHIYPPFFHIILAALIKLDSNKVILAKLFEVVVPVVFLAVLWNFVRRNFHARFAFFVMLAFCSSFSFYLSLLNHIPATLAFIFGFLAFGQLFNRRPLRALLLLTLCFYTHIGVSWFFAFSLFFYSAFYKELRRRCLAVLVCAFILSVPILYQQLIGLKAVSVLGLSLIERYTSQIKIVDYALALSGSILIFRADRKYRLFLSFFLASLIFLFYPYRFFSAEGYLPVIFLVAFALDSLYTRVKDKRPPLRYAPVLVALFILFLSPTLSPVTPSGDNRAGFKIKLADSAVLGMVFAKKDTIWFPREYLSAAALIKDNSREDDIIYSSFNIVGLTLACLSERSSANGLFPEIKPSRSFDRILTSKIIVFNQNDNPEMRNTIADSYKLSKIGENRLFILYRNPACKAKVDIREAVVSFRAILYIIIAFIFLYAFSDKAVAGIMRP